MIATILKSSSSFSAVRYNERKVENGVAELVAIRNFGYLQDAPDMRGITSLRNYLIDYSARNDRSFMLPFLVRGLSIPRKNSSRLLTST